MNQTQGPGGFNRIAGGGTNSKCSSPRGNVYRHIDLDKSKFNNTATSGFGTN